MESVIKKVNIEKYTNELVSKIDKDFAKKIYMENGNGNYYSSHLTEINFENTKSNLIKSNQNRLFASKHKRVEGLFRKDAPDPYKFGRKVCDFVKTSYNCYGFFTSDELPRYGITRIEKRHSMDVMGKQKKDGDLLVYFAYDYDFSLHINDFLTHFLDRLFK